MLLARIVDDDGNALRPADATSIVYTIRPVDPKGIASETPVAGHDAAPLTPSAVLFDSLQTSAVWTVDSEGYNFRHVIDTSQNEAFPDAGVAYQVRYELLPTSGQKTVFRFLLKAV